MFSRLQRSLLTLAVFSFALILGSVERLVSQEPVATAANEMWYGVLKTPTQWLRLTLHFSNKPDGTADGYWISHDQKSAKLPITKIERSEKNWNIELKTAGAKFVGQQSGDGSSVTGIFSQGGKDFDLKFERLDKLPQMQGTSVYRGELNAFVQKLQMQMRVIEGEQLNGLQLVLVDSLSEGVGSFAGSLAVDGEQLVVKVPALSATWKGKANLEDVAWSGIWSQGLVPLRLEWKLENEPLEFKSVSKKRPQTPQPPFPYESTDVVIDSPAQVKLGATLFVPKGAEKVPAVILISGSGPQDRNESLLKHQPFLVIADHLARKGIAVLRFDDRGVGKSTGNFDSAVTDDFIADAEAAFNFVAKHPQIDATKIGLLGHSEGSSVAISLGAKNSKVAFLVLMAGAGWNGRMIVVEQTLEMAKRQQTPAKSLEALRTMMEEHSEIVQSAVATKKFEEQVDSLVAKFIESAEIPADARETSKVVLAARLKQLNSAWYRDFLTRNPSDFLPQVKQPILALWGSEDVQVPASGNRDSMQAALGSSAHPKTKLEVLPGLNHLLQPCKTGLVDEYEAIETTISPIALDKFADFIMNATAINTQ